MLLLLPCQPKIELHPSFRLAWRQKHVCYNVKQCCDAIISTPNGLCLLNYLSIRQVHNKRYERISIFINHEHYIKLLLYHETSLDFLYVWPCFGARLGEVACFHEIECCHHLHAPSALQKPVTCQYATSLGNA